MLSVERRELQPQPYLFVRSRVPRAELARVIGEGLGKTFGHAMANGLTIAGPPLARYPEMADGMFTVEVGMPVAAAGPGAGEIQAGVLPGGAALVGTHAGSYDTLHETFAEMGRWMAAQGVAAGGPPWESYLTDPADHPDAADWRTEVVMPLTSHTA